MWYLKGYSVITAGEKIYFNSNHRKHTLLSPRRIYYIALKKNYFKAAHI